MKRYCVFLFMMIAAAPAAAWGDEWPTRGHDARRTAQSSSLGPESPSEVLTFAAVEGIAINIPPTVDAHSRVYFGTWGVTRSFGEEDPRLWDKFDGKVYALDGTTLAEPWGQPFSPDFNPYCYDYDGRQNPTYCPMGGTVTYYNGTVEGTATLTPDGSSLFVGRGDGKLYAIDAATGASLWTYKTFNPEDPTDPDGGGEIVGGPLLVDDTLYFATVRVGPHESNAMYAVSTQGQLKWRYPSDTRGVDPVFWASPVLSADGSTAYFAGAWGPAADERDTSLPGRVYAFDLTASHPPGQAPLKWTFDPYSPTAPGAPTVYAYTAAVGSDGTIYIGGTQLDPAKWGIPAVYALRDRGEHAELAWPAFANLDADNAALAFGLALREEGGETTRVYATSGNGYGLVGYGNGGVLAALAPSDGEALWSFNPLDYGGAGAMTGMAIDAAGVVYTGASGRSNGGMVFAVNPDGGLKWSYRLGGLLEWAHPVLGPDGALYVADTRRCLGAAQPIEEGACDGVDVAPTLYAIRGGETSGCDSSGGGSASWAAVALLMSAVWRRRREPIPPFTSPRLPSASHTRD